MFTWHHIFYWGFNKFKRQYTKILFIKFWGSWFVLILWFAALYLLQLPFRFRKYQLEVSHTNVVYIRGTLSTFWPQSSKKSLKQFIIAFPKKFCPEKVFYISSKKSPPKLKQTELPYSLLKKGFSYILGNVYLEPWHV